jgi:hypothetical protein
VVIGGQSHGGGFTGTGIIALASESEPESWKTRTVTPSPWKKLEVPATPSRWHESETERLGQSDSEKVEPARAARGRCPSQCGTERGTQAKTYGTEPVRHMAVHHDELASETSGRLGHVI